MAIATAAVIAGKPARIAADASAHEQSLDGEASWLLLHNIGFSILVGVATGLTGEKGKPFTSFLTSGAEVFMKIIQLVMYYAPIGLGAYFASLVGEFGTDLIGDYAKAVIIYYPVSMSL